MNSKEILAFKFQITLNIVIITLLNHLLLIVSVAKWQGQSRCHNEAMEAYEK